jgi:hypothetical protein
MFLVLYSLTKCFQPPKEALFYAHGIIISVTDHPEAIDIRIASEVCSRVRVRVLALQDLGDSCGLDDSAPFSAILWERLHVPTLGGHLCPLQCPSIWLALSPQYLPPRANYIPRYNECLDTGTLIALDRRGSGRYWCCVFEVIKCANGRLAGCVGMPVAWRGGEEGHIKHPWHWHWALVTPTDSSVVTPCPVSQS